VNSPSQAGYFLVELTLTGVLTAEELEEQRAFLKRLAGTGMLLLAAVVVETGGRGIAIISSASLEEARAVYATAPVVVAAKASVEIRALRITAGRLLL
jgi:uncharacterized protein YciI